MQELLAERSNQEIAFPLVRRLVHIVDKCLIQIEHQGVLALGGKPSSSRRTVDRSQLIIVGHRG